MTGWPARLPLHIRFTLVGAVVAIVTAALIITAQIQESRQFLIERAQTQLEERASVYNATLLGALIQANHAELHAKLEAMRAHAGIVYLAIHDETGAIAAASGIDPRRGLPAPMTELAEALRDGAPVFHALVPLRVGDHLYGNLRYGADLTYFAEASARMLRNGLLRGLVATVLAVLAFGLAGYWLGRQFRRLGAHGARLAAGDYGARLDMRGDDELGRLAVAYNDLGAAVETRVAALQRISGLYRVLGEVNKTIACTRGRDTLFAEICRILADSGLFRMAWIGWLDVADGKVRPIVSGGHDDGYTTRLSIQLDDHETGAGPTASAILGRQYVLCQDIATDPLMAHWREPALTRGYRASAAFPIEQDGQVVGSLNVYAGEPGFFSPDIVDLLLDLTTDIDYALVFMREVAARARAEADLTRLNAELEGRVTERTRQLEAANKELEAFSYSVSHDLRAPLRGIDGFSQILLTRYLDQLDERGQDYLRRVRRASQRMGELIDDLLQLSRISRAELRLTDVDLSALAGEIAEELGRREPARAVEWRIQPGLRARGDAGLLRIVLDNLLGNAWKFTGKLDHAVIEFSLDQDDGEPVFHVRDNGAGFNMAYVHKLFGAFQRLHATDEFEGTGIGLATVQRIIRRHGGYVWAESAAGKGASFHFTIGDIHK